MIDLHTLNQCSLTFVLIDNVRAYYWTGKCVHVTCNTLNQSLLTFTLTDDMVAYY